MRKIGLIIFCMFFLISVVSAISLQIEKQDSQNIYIPEIGNQPTFNLKIKNLGASDNFEFYNFLGFRMFPIGTTPILSGQTKLIELKITPPKDFSQTGAYTFEYFIKGNNLSSQKDQLTIRTINLKDFFEIGANKIDPESNSLEIYIYNKEKFEFEDLNVKFSSAFFEKQENFTLGPNERKNFTIQLNKKDFNQLTAGFYTLNAEVLYEGAKANVEGTIEFSEKDLLKVEKQDYGFFIHTQIIKKENNGNVISDAIINLNKNIISRLFTTFSPIPDVVERNGFSVNYAWNKKLKPGEELEVIVKTNWFFPLLIILFIIVVVILAKQYVSTDLLLKKKLTFVKAKGGEFALKVSIIVGARKYVENITIIDRLPSLVKLYEKFGVEKPKRIDEKKRKIEWSFNQLEAGEKRIISYVVYSKIGVVGKFALPATTAIYEKDGKLKETQSNRAFFISEQDQVKEDEK